MEGAFFCITIICVSNCHFLFSYSTNETNFVFAEVDVTEDEYIAQELGTLNSFLTASS